MGIGNNAEYISVSELSKRVGKSKQWIYKLIKTDPDFKKYVKTVGGIAMVNKSVITEFFAPVEVKKPDEQLVETLIEQVAYLKKQYDDLMKLFEREQYFRAQEKTALAEMKLLIANLQAGGTTSEHPSDKRTKEPVANNQTTAPGDPAVADAPQQTDQEREPEQADDLTAQTVTEEPATAPNDPAGGRSEAEQEQAVTDQADGPEQITAPEVPEQANTPERDMTTETEAEQEQAIAPEEPERKAAPEDAALVGKTTFWQRLKWLLFGE